MDGIIQFLVQITNNYIGKNLTWFKTIIEDSLVRRTNVESNSKFKYNATILDNITVTLLGINVKTVIKIKLIFDCIKVLWEQYNGNVNLFQEFFLTDKPFLSLPTNLL